MSFLVTKAKGYLLLNIIGVWPSVFMFLASYAPQKWSHMVDICLVFWGTSMLIPIVVTPVHSPNNIVHMQYHKPKKMVK